MLPGEWATLERQQQEEQQEQQRQESTYKLYKYVPGERRLLCSSFHAARGLRA